MINKQIQFRLIKTRNICSPKFTHNLTTANFKITILLDMTGTIQKII